MVLFSNCAASQRDCAGLQKTQHFQSLRQIRDAVSGEPARGWCKRLQNRCTIRAVEPR